MDYNLSGYLHQFFEPIQAGYYHFRKIFDADWLKPFTVIVSIN